ncbi:endonuclease/exonuclease/phosphatase family protein [Klugiella xanthotipulae]|uniref:Vancomycin resistance protein VanJ n=1 Tax=Klugiella xanthotipulae TaxID=244735 RepID=A0A543I6P0_9MICO|nr:endonuclease/exonuclease/phosphatase family protein [Klugiella xanthotipulae]TQM66272.1 vancomycin resistance protein VanJ [Klugiella xanthotipulae]
MFASPRSSRPASLPRSRRGRASAWFVVIVSLALLAVFIGHRVIRGTLGTVVAAALPWLGLLLPVLLLVALVARRPRAALVVLAPAVAWSLIFVPHLVPLTPPTTAAPSGTIVAASQNVEVSSGTAAESALGLVDAGADVIALVELSTDASAEAAAALADTHPYSYVVGTLGVWSVFPIRNEQPLTLGLSWKRAITLDVETEAGLVSIYAVHAASFRPGEQVDRDVMLNNLAEMVKNDPNERAIILGDFNATSDDPALSRLYEYAVEANQSDISLGFTWPTIFPVARIDHIFAVGLDPVESTVRRVGHSDHLAVIATFNL